MNEKQLKALVGKTCELYVNMKAGGTFHYKGTVLEVSENFFSLIDDKTGRKVSCPISSILSIVQGGDQP